MIEIRTMKRIDIEFALELTDREEWGHLKRDFQRFLRLDPESCFVVWDADLPLGIATTISYDDYAFLGNVIVRKEMRGRGIGPMLMEHALAFLDNKGVRTVELDGVFAAVPVYRMLGFKDKYLSLRFLRKATAESAIATDRRLEVARSVREIMIFDHEKTSIERSAMLRELAKDYARTIYCLRKKKPYAYAVVKKRADGSSHIGPLVADDRSACEKMVKLIVAGHQKNTLSIGVPEINRAASRIMRDCGFEYRLPSLRMYRGLKKDYERYVYGIVSADVG
jgi:GNAT superfamily N-acetyltransferase